ncbi:hypothetical protein [Flavobacterium phage FPSV-S29]|nr:hypothetical protein [Flavobacterium phage FPSV-S29]
MACTVEIQDIQEEIKLELKEKFESIKFTKYRDRLAGFIPYDINNPTEAKDPLFGRVQYQKNKYNTQYNSKLYGEVVSFNQTKEGIEFNIHPTIKLAKAMSNQNEQDAYNEARAKAEKDSRNEGRKIQNEYDEMRDLPPTFSEDDFEYMPSNSTNTPVSKTVIQPNFNDVLEHKRKLLINVDKTITRLYNDKRLHDSVEITKKIAKFNLIKDSLEKDIKDFNSNIDKVSLIRDFFEKDIQTINELLSNPTLDNVFLAKTMFDYLERTKKSEAKDTDIFALNSKQEFEKEVQDIIDYIEKHLEKTKNRINETVDDIFLQLLEKNEDNLSKLYPGLTLEEIKEELLKKLQDINKIESYFFTQGTNLLSENNIIDQLIILEYKREKQFQNNKIQPIIESINNGLPAIEEELKRLGKFFTFRKKTVFDYNWLYRKDKVAEPELISKFSKTYENTIYNLQKKYQEDLYQARSQKDWAEVERLLKNKFNDLNDKVEFLNFTLLHDIFDDPIYDSFKRGTTQEADNYKQEIIAKIGQEEYDKAIENQRNLLDKYLNEAGLIIQAKLDDENVADEAQLSGAAKDSIENSLQRISPLAFLDSFYAGNSGMVELNYGTQKDEKPSYIKFNAYIPKVQNNLGIDTGFFDENFKDIENNPVMYDFWKRMKQGVELINENLVDSDLKVKHNSILSFKEGITKQVLDKSFKTQLKEVFSKYTNLLGLFKSMISAKNYKHNESEYVQLAHQIKTTESEVSKDFALLKTDVSNILGKTLMDNTVIHWNSLSLEQQDKILAVTGMQNAIEFLDNLDSTNGIFGAGDLRIFSKIKNMEQQSLNLPAVIKGLLELSADHKARAASKNETNIYRMKSADILTKDNGWHQKKDEVRENEVKRQDFFYEKVILNKNQKDHPGGVNNISDILRTSLNKEHFNAPIAGKIFYKNFNKEEKGIYDSAIERIKQLENEISQTTSPKKVEQLNIEKAALHQRIELLGKDYMISALFDNIVNKLRVKVGLGYNLLAGVNNYKQGFITSLNRDGMFWQKGNIYPVQHFVDLGVIRHVNPTYKQKWETAKLFIEKLGIVETGTNELQKAEAEIKNRAGWMQPMFITEKVEYRNQAKGILAMAMDVEVEHATEKNPDGTPAKYPLFNGSDFIPYINNNGVLELKPEFDTPTNREHLITMTSKDISDWKLNVRAMNNSMNGDYTKEGVTRIKGSLFTRPLMTFKTWIPEYIGARWKYQQKNVLTGEVETGFMLSSLLNKKTSVAAGLMFATTGALGMVTASPILIAGFVASLGFGFGYTKYIAHKNRNTTLVDNTEPIAMVQQAMYWLKMINPVALAEMPVNTIFGKELIKPVEFKSELNLTEQEKKDLRAMGRNMQHLAILMLVKIAIQAFLKDNDDDEPKGEEGTEQRAKYEAQKLRRAEGDHTYNFLENMITGTFNESSFGTDPAALWKAGSEGGIEGQLKSIMKLGAALCSPTEEIQKGPRQGQNKLRNAAASMFIPALFRDLGHDTYRFGFENSMLTEWDKSEGLDGIFNSDFKDDKKELKEAKQAKIQELLEEFETENNVEYDELPEVEQDVIDKEIKEELGDEFKIYRENYDEEQNKSVDEE